AVDCELGHGNGSVLAIAVGGAVIGKALAQNGKRVLNDFRVLSSARVSELLSRGLQSALCVFEAIYNIVGVLGVIALIERKAFEACKADKVSIPKLFDRDAPLSKQFGTDFFHFVMVEDHR